MSSSGNADSPLENHLYYTSYGARMEMPIRLTKEEHDHSKICLCIESNLFVSVYSNISTPPKCEIFRFCFSLSFKLDPFTLKFRLSTQQTLPKFSLAFILSTTSILSTSSSISVSKKSKPNSANHCQAQLFSFVNKTGDTIYGMLYQPVDAEPDKRYPTICYVYGGPSVQVRFFFVLKFVKISDNDCKLYKLTNLTQSFSMAYRL